MIPFPIEVNIDGAPIGADHPCMIVAEIGPNHNGDLVAAIALIEAAAAAGCDAVKFQYRIADAEIFDRTTRSYYYDESRYDFIRRVQEMPHTSHETLREKARSLNLKYLCSVFSEDAVEKVASLIPDAIKIPSGEASNPWLLERVKKVGRPIVTSSGMSPLAEIDTMIDLLRGHSAGAILLHCVSEYPTQRDDMNLRMIPELNLRYGCPVGLSDHSRNLPEVAASVALGAAMIEVHFTLDRNAQGPDHRVSLLPAEMKELVASVRNLEAALGRPEKRLGQHASQMRASFTNSIVARRPIAPGEVLSQRNLTLKKPGTGMGPERLAEVIGRRARVPISADAPIRPEDLS